MRARIGSNLKGNAAGRAQQSKAGEPDGAACSCFAAAFAPHRRAFVRGLPSLVPQQQQQRAFFRHALLLFFSFCALLLGTWEGTNLYVYQRLRPPYEFQGGSFRPDGHSSSASCSRIPFLVTYASALQAILRSEEAAAVVSLAAAASALPPHPASADPATANSRVTRAAQTSVAEAPAAAPSNIEGGTARLLSDLPVPPAAAAAAKSSPAALPVAHKGPASRVEGTGTQSRAAATASPPTSLLTAADLFSPETSHGELRGGMTTDIGEASAERVDRNERTPFQSPPEPPSGALQASSSSPIEQTGVFVRRLAGRGSSRLVDKEGNRGEKGALTRRLLPWLFQRRPGEAQGPAARVPPTHASAARPSLPFLSAYTYKEVLQELQELQARFSHLLRIYSWADQVGLAPFLQQEIVRVHIASAGDNGEVQMIEEHMTRVRRHKAENHDCQDGLRCSIPLVELTNFSAATTATPTLFFSGAIHGDERAGPTAAVELLRYLCERYDKESEVYYLVNNRRLLVMPFPNAVGFAWRFRNEISVDVNRDFPYDQEPHECFRSVASRAVNEVFRRNVILAGISWHGGMRAIAYPWGSYNHAASSGNSWLSQPSPDAAAFQAIAGAMQATGGRLPGTNEWYYPIGDMTTSVYPVRGGMEDWAYGIGFEASPSPITICTPSQAFPSEPALLRQPQVPQQLPATEAQPLSPQPQGVSGSATGQRETTRGGWRDITALRPKARAATEDVKMKGRDSWDDSNWAEASDGQQVVPVWRYAKDGQNEDWMELAETEAATGRPRRLGGAVGGAQAHQQDEEEDVHVLEEDDTVQDTGDYAEELEDLNSDAAADEAALKGGDAGDSWIETTEDWNWNAGNDRRTTASTGRKNGEQPPMSQVVEDVTLAARGPGTDENLQASDASSTSAGSDYGVDVAPEEDEAADTSSDIDYPPSRSVYGSGDGRTLLILLEMHDEKHPLPDIMGPRPVDVPGLLLPEERNGLSLPGVMSGPWDDVRASEEFKSKGEALILRNVRAALKLMEKVSPDLLFTSVPPTYQPQGAVSLVAFYPVGCQTLSSAQLQIRRGRCSSFFVKRTVETKPFSNGDNAKLRKSTPAGGKLPRGQTAVVEGTGAAAAAAGARQERKGWQGTEEEKDDVVLPDSEEYELRIEEWERAPLLLQEAAKELPARCREIGEWERLRGSDGPMDIPPQANEWWGEGGNKDIELNKGSPEERRGRVEIQYKIPPDASNGEYCSLVIATFDQDWGNLTNADADTWPQAHVTRLRLEDKYEAHSSEGRSAVVGHRYWIFPMNLPALYPVVFSAGLPLHVRDDNVEGSAEVHLLLPTASAVHRADGEMRSQGKQPSHVAVDVFIHLGGNFSEKRLRLDPFTGAPRFLGDKNFRMTIDRTDISVRLSHPHFVLADGLLQIRVLEEGNLAGHALQQLLSDASITTHFSSNIGGAADVGRDRQVKTLLLAEFPTGRRAFEVLQSWTLQQKVQRLKQRYQRRRTASPYSYERSSEDQLSPTVVSYLDPQTLHGIAATPVTSLLGRVVIVRWFRQTLQGSPLDQRGRSLQSAALPHVAASTVVWSSLFTPSIRQFVYEEVPPLSFPPKMRSTAEEQETTAASAQYVSSLLCLFTTERSSAAASTDAAAAQGTPDYPPRHVDGSTGAAGLLRSAVGYLKMTFVFAPQTRQRAPRQQLLGLHRSRERLLMLESGGYTLTEGELCGVQVETDVDATYEKLYIRFDKGCCPMMELHAVADEGEKHGHTSGAAQHEKARSFWWPDFLLKAGVRSERGKELPKTEEGGDELRSHPFLGENGVTEPSARRRSTARKQEWKPKKWKLQERDRLKMLTSCSCGPGTVVTVSASEKEPATNRDPHRFAQSPFYNAAYVLPSPDMVDPRGFRTLSCALSIIPAPGATAASPVAASASAAEAATTESGSRIADPPTHAGSSARVARMSPVAATSGSRNGLREHAQAGKGDPLAAFPPSSSFAATAAGVALVDSAAFLSRLVCGNRHQLKWRERRGVKEGKLANKAALSQASTRTWRTFEVGNSLRNAEQQHPIAAKAAAESAAYAELHGVARARRGVEMRDSAKMGHPEQDVLEFVNYLEATKQDDTGDESHSLLQPELYALVLVLLLVGVCMISPCLVSLRYCLRTSHERRAVVGAAPLTAISANSSDEEEEQSIRPGFLHDAVHRDSFDEEHHSIRTQQEAYDSETLIDGDGEERGQSGLGWREGVEVRSVSTSCTRPQAGKGGGFAGDRGRVV